MALNASTLFNSMLAEATKTAGAKWTEISGIATQELRSIAVRVKEIVAAVATGSLKPKVARSLMEMVKNNAIAAIAMFTTLIKAAAQAIINAALRVVRNTVNTAAGFALF